MWIIRMGCAFIFVMFCGALVSGWLMGLGERIRNNRMNAELSRDIRHRIMSYGDPEQDILNFSRDDDTYMPPSESGWETVISVTGTTADLTMRRGKMKRAARFQLVGGMLTISHVVPTTGMIRYPLELELREVIRALGKIKENAE